MHAADPRFIGEHDAQMPLASRCRRQLRGGAEVILFRGIGAFPTTRTRLSRATHPILSNRGTTRANADRVEHELRARGTPITARAWFLLLTFRGFCLQQMCTSSPRGIRSWSPMR